MFRLLRLWKINWFADKRVNEMAGRFGQNPWMQSVSHTRWNNSSLFLHFFGIKKNKILCDYDFDNLECTHNARGWGVCWQHKTASCQWLLCKSVVVSVSSLSSISFTLCVIFFLLLFYQTLVYFQRFSEQNESEMERNTQLPYATDKLNKRNTNTHVAFIVAAIFFFILPSHEHTQCGNNKNTPIACHSASYNDCSPYEACVYVLPKRDYDGKRSKLL